MQLVMNAILSAHLLILAGVSVDSKCHERTTCMSYEECTDQHQDLDFIAFRCENGKRKICCPPIQPSNVRLAPRPRESLTKPRPLTYPTDFQPESHATTLSLTKEKKHLLPVDCGRTDSTGDQIIQGEFSRLGQFPWMALLGFRKNTSEIVYLCGGTLISNQYVLTAAHCVNNSKIGSPVSVRLGEHDLSAKLDCDEEGLCAPPTVDVDVERVIIHPSYKLPYMKNDIALLRLSSTVNPTTYVSPICLPFGINITGEELKTYIAAGWGKTEYDDVSGSNNLKFVELSRYDQSDCNDVDFEEARQLDHTQLCAGGRDGRDTCNGDSGGPLMDLRLQRSGVLKTYQIGIVSFGTNLCGADGIPSVYTRVDMYLQWILDNIVI